MKTHLSLFSGIGGLDLAAEAAGFVTVGQCELADYPTKILEKHWPDVPRWRDIRTLTGESFYEKTGLRTVDVVSGGFPCQPFSVAGKRGGKEDDRYLWTEMLRVIHELRPSWVIGENVPGIINMALNEVLADLEAEGYESQGFLVPACGVDAPHKRFRIAILAHADGKQLGWERTQKDAGGDGTPGLDFGGGAAELLCRELGENEPFPAGMADGVRTAVHEADPDAEIQRLQGQCDESLLVSAERERERERELRSVPASALRTAGGHSAWDNWPDEPGVGRVVDGIPDRVDRIKCLGNAVVPQQFYPFFKAIMDIETGE